MSDFETLNELYITVAGEGTFRIIPSRPINVVEEKIGRFKLSNLTKAAFPIKIVNDSGKPFNWATNPKQFIDVSKPAPGTGSGTTGGACAPLFGPRVHVDYRSVSASGSTTFGAAGSSSQTNINLCRFTAAPGDMVTFYVTSTGPSKKIRVSIAECVEGTWVRSRTEDNSVSFTSQTTGEKILIISPVAEEPDGGVTFTVKGVTKRVST